LAESTGVIMEQKSTKPLSKYSIADDQVMINGNQALVRLLLQQREADRRNGLDTAGFVSGYRGSPLGGLDAALWHAGDLLERNNIRFQPGVNEDLAATAVTGTQQLDLVPDPQVDGVFSIWYGKGPGVDRGRLWRRSPWKVLDRGEPERSGAGIDCSSVTLSGQRYGVHRVWPEGLGIVAILGALGRLQMRQRNHRADRDM